MTDLQQDVQFQTETEPATSQPPLLPEFVTQRKYVAFDLEVARPFQNGRDWRPLRPLGICCAGLAFDGGDAIETPLFWGFKSDAAFAIPAPRLSQKECVELVAHLMVFVNHGFTIVTWNGLGFDFDILAEESNLQSECRELARHHVDMMFQVFCMKGHPLALDAVAKGMGLAGKMPGVEGALIPQMWAWGDYEEVKAYTAQDARTTLEVALAVEKKRELSYYSRAGSWNNFSLPRWLTVEEAMALPLPDTRGLKNPWSRGRFTGWLQDE